MTLPFVTMMTAGILLTLQMLFAATTSASRGKANTWVGDGRDDALLRAMRRHGNLAENAAIFSLGFLLLEISQFNRHILAGMCATFILLRVLHAIGLSQRNTNNPLRLLGGAGTYMLGLALAGCLLWIGGKAVLAAGLL